MKVITYFSLIEKFYRATESKFAEAIRIEDRVFPDGELNPRIVLENGSSIENDHIVLYFPKKSSESPNDYLLRLFLLIDTVKKLKASEITAIIPYFPYARQDKVFRPGEPLSAKVVAKILENLGINRIITVTPHIQRIKDFSIWFEHAEVKELSGIKVLATWIKDNVKLDKNTLFVAPDWEAAKWAREMATLLGYSEEHVGRIAKERDVNTGEIQQKIIDVPKWVNTDTKVVIVDDIVSSGKTMVNAAKLLQTEKGIKNFIFSYVHPVHSPGAIDLLLSLKPQTIVCTDTILLENASPRIKQASILPFISSELAKLK